MLPNITLTGEPSFGMLSWQLVGVLISYGSTWFYTGVTAAAAYEPVQKHKVIPHVEAVSTWVEFDFRFEAMNLDLSCSTNQIEPLLNQHPQ